MWVTKEDEQMMEQALRGVSPPAFESFGYIKGLYCPRCGAQRVRFDLSHTYICKHKHVVCNHCRHGFENSLDGRWRLRSRVAKRWSIKKQPPVEGLDNPNNWHKRRKEIKEMTAKANDG